jgi:DNA-binding NarL/FixJ family response regulator
LPAIRIVLGTMPGMLREIIREVFSSQPDMVIVSEPSSEADLAVAVAESEADLVVVELNDDTLGQVGEQLLRSRPRLKSLGISRDGRRAAVYELVPDRTRVFEVSPEGLRAAARQAVHPRET